MRCTTCGEEVGLLHECLGPPAAVRELLKEPPPRLRFAPLHYLLQAAAIARFDEKAILRISRDNNAFLYGVPLWFVATIPLVLSLAVQRRMSLLVALIFVIIALPVAFILQLVIWGLCHLGAKLVLRGKGSLAAVVRVMLLGSIVGVIGIIPVVGLFLASLWSLAIMMLTFEAVHGIRRTHAFAISLIVGILIRAVGLI